MAVNLSYINKKFEREEVTLGLKHVKKKADAKFMAELIDSCVKAHGLDDKVRSRLMLQVDEFITRIALGRKFNQQCFISDHVEHNRFGS